MYGQITSCEYCWPDPGQRDPHVYGNCICDCHSENKARNEREHFLSIHLKINSRSAHMLYEACEKLEEEFMWEQSMDMSNDAYHIIQKHKEQAFKRLYRYYGLRSRQEWVSLMEEMSRGHMIEDFCW